LYHAPIEERRKLIITLVLIAKGMPLGGGYQRYLETHLSGKTHADLDQLLDRCEKAILKIQAGWPICYPISKREPGSAALASKLYHHEMLSNVGSRNCLAGQFRGVVYIHMMSPGAIVKESDDAGMIIMN
jgi:hypothetical protein